MHTPTVYMYCMTDKAECTNTQYKLQYATNLINHMVHCAICHIMQCRVRIRDATTQKAVVGVQWQRQARATVSYTPLD